ncbi:MICOS complex subunit MIC13 homolog QIL1, partial [Diaphorina citri]|uniref:MICOS complex subunit MIC13 n=1 Tax=Diaphorina citri TaxID=121845 RepID=A0A3Q0JDD6_DIACI
MNLLFDSRFGTKVGLVGAAVYYTNEYGVWQDADSSAKVVQELRKLYHQQVSPYVKDVKTNVPLEVPEIPSISDIGHSLGSSWNSGVLSTFNFLANLPSHVNQWTTDASNFINKQLEASGESSK